jgi:hypothetical protein
MSAENSRPVVDSDGLVVSKVQSGLTKDRMTTLT